MLTIQTNSRYEALPVVNVMMVIWVVWIQAVTNVPDERVASIVIVKWT
jgi:hypothetical protein